MDDKQKYMDDLNELDTVYNMLNDTEYKQSIDYWQDIRAKAAIVIMHAYLESPAKPKKDVSLEKSVGIVVKIADALVEELKKTRNIWKQKI